MKKLALLAAALLTAAAANQVPPSAPTLVNVGQTNETAAVYLSWSTHGSNEAYWFDVQRRHDGKKDRKFRLNANLLESSYYAHKNETVYRWTDTNDVVLNVVYTYKIKTYNMYGDVSPWSEPKKTKEE